MSSNSIDESFAAAAAAFQRDQLSPLAVQLRAKGRAVFASGPDETAKSYFVPAERPVFVAEDFRLGDVETPAGLVDALLAHWRAGKRSELETLASGLRELIAHSAPLTETQDDSLSPYLYVMY